MVALLTISCNTNGSDSTGNEIPANPTPYSVVTAEPNTDVASPYVMETVSATSEATASHATLLTPLTVCQGDKLAFTLIGRDENGTLGESGIYISCIDGSSRQRIMQFETTGRFTNLSPDHMSVSPDGTKLILSARDDTTRTWRVIEISLGTGQTTELLTGGEILRQAMLSPEERYLTYVTSANMSISLYDLESHQTTTIFNVEPNYSIHSFNWSPDGKQLVVETVGPLGQTQSQQVFTLNVTCSDTQFTCSTSNQLDFHNVLGSPIWTSNSSLLSIGGGANPTLRLTDTSDRILDEIVLSTLGSNLLGIREASIIPNKEQVAILGTRNGSTTLFVLDLSSRSLIEVTSDSRDVIYSNLILIPSG